MTLALAGCSFDPYVCTDPASCVQNGQQGQCLAAGDGRSYCAFADSICSSSGGLRWDDSAAPPYAGQCVGAVQPGVDLAGADLAGADLTALPDLARPIDFAGDDLLGLDFAQPTVDQSMTPDLARPVDLAGIDLAGRDFALPVDQSLPPDLAQSIDLTQPPDLAPPLFLPPVASATGNIIPDALAAGDLNRDGRADLVVGYFNGAEGIDVMLGKGGGNFLAPVHYDVPGATLGLALGDLNGDGWLDIVAPNYVSANVSVLINNGGGGFAAPTNYAVTAMGEPRGVVIADFNGDGKNDVATANENSDTITVLIGNGDGTLKPGIDYPVSLGPFNLVAADFNHDGKLDLAAACYPHNEVDVLPGTGSGTFGAYVTTNYMNEAPSDLALGDFNGDGKLDLATVDFGDRVAILLDTNANKFTQFSIFPSLTSASRIATGDFNHDGRLDAATANPGDPDGPSVAVLFGDGTGKLNEPPLRLADPNLKGAAAIAVADIDGDGKRDDIVVADDNNDQVLVFLAR
jgi:hypothetical protein